MSPATQAYLIPFSDPIVESSRRARYAIVRVKEARIDEGELPAGPWGNAVSLALSRAGVLFSAGAVPIGRTGSFNMGPAGLYVLNQGRFSRLVPGLISDMRVSPDGCRVAVGYDSLTSEVRPPARLLIVDLYA